MSSPSVLARPMPVNVPNVLSLLRLGAVPVLWGALVTGERGIFAWLLLAALLTDIADGLVARLARLHTPSGAFLDSVADALVTVTAVGGLARFARPVLAAHAASVGGVLGLYVLGVVAALWRYGRLAAFHTYACRATAYVQGLWMLLLLFGLFDPLLHATMVVVSGLAYTEELVLVALVRRWTPDVRGVWSARWRRGR